MTTPETTQTTFRPVTDFLIGLIFFILVAGCFSVSDGQAYVGPADAANWPTTVTYASDATGLLWQSWARDGAVVLLGLTFASLTAFNMSIARHLRAVAVATKPEKSSELVQEASRPFHAAPSKPIY